MKKLIVKIIAMTLCIALIVDCSRFIKKQIDTHVIDVKRAEYVRDRVKIPKSNNIYADINLYLFMAYMMDINTTFSTSLIYYYGTSWLPSEEINWNWIYELIRVDMYAGRIPKAKHLFDYYIHDIINEHRPKGFRGDEVGHGKVDIYTRQLFVNAIETLLFFVPYSHERSIELVDLTEDEYSIFYGTHYDLKEWIYKDAN